MTRNCESSSATIALIGCGKQKRSHACEAGELYIGQLFTARREWAEANADAYWIASAKHLILEPDQVIEPYDLSLRDLDADTRRWRARQIQLHFRSRWRDFCRFEEGPSGFIVAVDRPRVVLLASREYLFGFHEWRERHPGDSFEFETPLSGLGIGQQMAWLRQQVRDESRHRPLVEKAKYHRHTKKMFLESLTEEQAKAIRRVFQVDPGSFWQACRGKRFLELPPRQVQLRLPFEDG